MAVVDGYCDDYHRSARTLDIERPLVAWLRELDERDNRDEREQWVVLHRIT
jgi:hypothetical protein